MNHKQNLDSDWGEVSINKITTDSLTVKHAPVNNEIQDNFKYKKIVIIPIVLMIIYIILFKK